MADEKLSQSRRGLTGMGVKVQDITWFPGDIVQIERQLPKSLFKLITSKQKELRKSGEALLRFRHGVEFCGLSPLLLEYLFCSFCVSLRIITENFKCNTFKGQRRFFRGEFRVC